MIKTEELSVIWIPRPGGGLCNGQWYIEVDGTDKSALIPEKLRYTHSLKTKVVDYEVWLAFNPWAKNITKKTKELYDKISEIDLEWNTSFCLNYDGC